MLQQWLYAIPVLLVVVCAVGWLENRFPQIGSQLQSTASSETVAVSQPNVESDPWSPGQALAPYAPALWLVLTVAIAAMLLLALGVALVRVLPEKRYRHVSPGGSSFSEPKNVFVKRQHLLRILANDVNALFEGRLKVRHVMTRSPITISPVEPIESACELMESRNVHHLAVCNDDGLLIGMLSLHYARRTNAKTVGKTMLTDPLSVPPDALLNPTVTQMISSGASCAAVVADGYCVGILTTADVQLTLQCALTLLFRATAEDSGRWNPSDSHAAPRHHAVNLDEMLESVRPEP